VVQDIKSKVYGAKKGNLEDPNRLGNVMYNRGVTYGIIVVEALRVAQANFGKGKVMTPQQLRWGFEHLNLSESRIKELGAAGLFPPIKTSCADHEGSGMVKFQRWDGTGFKQVTPFMAGDRDMVRKMVEESAAKYAVEKKIAPRDCAKENNWSPQRRRHGRRLRSPLQLASGIDSVAVPTGQSSRHREGRSEAGRFHSSHEPFVRSLVRPMNATASAGARGLSVNNVEVIYDHVILVLKGVSLEVPQGQIVALLGANGAGKTTTLKAISNLLGAERGDVTKGTIEFMGRRVDKLTPNDLVKMGVCQVMEGRHFSPT
jgi:hypothetical protein